MAVANNKAKTRPLYCMIAHFNKTHNHKASRNPPYQLMAAFSNHLGQDNFVILSIEVNFWLLFSFMSRARTLEGL